ncbi:MAG TPA: cyclopropane fatty acyl phospholipid synthase [Fibrobacteria bacterium]|nr:cyclopropane fatty acyl phospholipid synthase [Fibrobacteria bacterium]
MIKVKSPGRSQAEVEEVLSKANIRIGGTRPWDIRVHNDRFYDRVLAQGSLGLGESYVEEWWDCDALDEFFARCLKLGLESRIENNFGLLLASIEARLRNLQTKSEAMGKGKRHYEIGNDLYKAMLDKRMVYTCAYWKHAHNLDDAQEAKLDLTCRKLGLEKGMRVLDIGCGWGSFAKFAAERYGVEVVGVTVAERQVELGRESCRGLPVEIRLQDYRDVDGTFDHIVSLGMFEHVGYKNYREYMEVAHRCLKEGGLFLLHTIGGNKSMKETDPFIDKHIFPNSMIPSIAQIGSAIEDVFVMEDWHNLSTDYDRTLCSWHANFDRHWPLLQKDYGEAFRRKWRYYLLQSAGSFRARKIQLWQIVLSKRRHAQYQSIR